MAWWLRLIDKCRSKISKRGGLSTAEIREAEILILRKCQLQTYSGEIDRLIRGNSVLKSSPIRSLSPYVDREGLLRVGGRLNEMKGEVSKPCIISHKHPIAVAIVNEVHMKAHVGAEWTHSLVRQKFWIVKGRSFIKKVIRNCVKCKRLHAKPCTQIMADLPRERIVPSKPPFTYTGIDVFGPFYVKVGRSEVKRYGCMFTCMVTRAIHIEKINYLDTESFINALHRFVSRRGCPEKIFSDRGTNFVGAEAELRRELSQLSKRELEIYAVRQNIEWNFIPPSASHMGGAWERMIGCSRRVMRSLLSRDVRLTDEILETVFAEVGSIVNGRPLTKLSDDPNDPSPLTPNHLLLLREGPMLPWGKFDKADTYRYRWKHIHHLVDQFWRKWVKMYLPLLQRRVKWVDIHKNLKVGDLILMLDANTPRSLWPLGLIKEVQAGRDGLVRSVRIRTRSAEFVRPITKVVLLESVDAQP